ncbi:MAG: hypothetical protein HN675_09940 [Opitutae bacterium]|jgi:hypothetical protein|nr:hypothetical protein [Opitutae bacterium]MBT5692855.1 hypothetical protein [Opitutae bacterium]MBT7853630.1 hypothetical protein [Opitutae bacterium]
MFDENAQFAKNPNKEGLYEIAARELTKSPKKGLYAKCLAECEGHHERARAFNLKERVKQLKAKINSFDKMDRLKTSSQESNKKRNEDQLKEWIRWGLN